MNKWLIFALLATFNIGASAQDVRYYKLSSTRIGGTTNKNVSGGQFITFVSDICFESSSKGVGVGHGTLTRNNNRKIVSGCHMENVEPRNLLVWDKHALTFRRKPTYKEAGM